MKKEIGIYKEAWLVFLKNYEKFVGYQLVSGMLLTVVLIPLLKFVFNAMMKLGGYDYIANGLIQRFLASPVGLLTVIFMLVFGFLLLMIELGGLVVIAHQCIMDEKESRFVDIVVYTLKRLKYLVGVDGILVVIYFLLLAPLIDAEYSVGVLEGIAIPGFIMDVLLTNGFYTSLLAVVFLVIITFSLRWMFSIHILLLDQKVKRKFIFKSKIIFKANKYFIIRSTILHTLLDFLVASVITILVLTLSILLISQLDLPIEMIVTFILYLLITLVYIFSIISRLLGMIRMTLMYHGFSDEVDKINVRTRLKGSYANKFLSNKVILGLSVFLMIGGVFVYSYVIEENLMNVKYDVAITAHRGSSFDAPENTLAALGKAIENGADYAEIDVQLTKDGQIILLHDETFKRVSGVDKRPDEMTLAEIKTLDAGLWFDQTFEGEEIPTLEEVIDFCRGKLKLNIEVKGSGYSPTINEKLVEIINRKNLYGECIVTSLSLDDLIEVESLNPKVETGYVMFIALGNLEKLPVDLYSVEASNVNENFVQNAHELGRQVHVWTINDNEMMEDMLKLGVDNIITDKDIELRKLLDDKEKYGLQ